MLVSAFLAFALCPPKLLAPSKLVHRWVYVATNLQVVEQADKVCALIVRAHKAGYNGIVLADSKMQRLGDEPDYYFTNAKKVVATAAANDVEIVPCVFPVGYADSMLSHDPNLIEGLPVKDAPFVVSGNEARPATGDTNLLPNGDLTQSTNNKFAGLGFQDAPGQVSFADNTEMHNGKPSARLENFGGANGRLVWQVEVQPFHQYTLSGWSQRKGLKGLIQAIALDGQGHDLVVNDFPQDSDAAWTPFKVSFNSLDNAKLGIYMGVWGGSAGKLWLSDIALRDAGLLNVIRRPGCPVTVSKNGTLMKEGKDYEEVKDPGLGQTPWPGSYDVDHAAPAIKIISGGRIKDGDRLSVSYYAAKTGIGNQTAICLSEPKTNELMADEAKRVADLFHPKGLFWSHDEIKVGGWCEACIARHLTPGQMLAENARTCGKIQQKVLPGSTTYVWSDMFDPFHNAVDHYYLTNGTLANSWRGLPADAVIVNWNYGNRAKSLPFFANEDSPGGPHQQIIAGYYDAPVAQVKDWLADAAKVKGVTGIIYTTWVGNYADLEAFAKAAWGGKS